MKTLSLKGVFSVLAMSGLVFVASTEFSTAGVILVSGDSNTTDNLGSGDDTDTFFQNILGTGSSVGVLDFTNPSGGSANDTDTEVNNFYNGLGGATSTLISGTVTAGSLSGVDLFIAPTPDDNFSASEVAVLSSFLNSNGTIFLLGENFASVFSTGINAINQLLDDLGSSIDMVPGDLDGQTVNADPFTAGVTSIRYVSGSEVSGGTTLLTSSNGTGLIARENFGGNTPIPEPTAVSLFGLGLVGLGIAVRRRKTH